MSESGPPAVTRTGWGVDVHPLGGEPPLRLAGVVVSEDHGLVGTSDADVVAHAVADALFGVACLGDIGMHFPSNDPEMEDIDSMSLLSRVFSMVTKEGFSPIHVDVTVIAESIRVAPHRESMRLELAGALGLTSADVSVKATTTDGLGFIGSDLGVAAVAVVTARGRS